GAGLDREDLEAALAEEEARTLALVGVDVGHFDVPLPRPPARAPRFGTSAKAALERTLRIAAGRGDRRLEPGHLLLALLDDGGGRVPRVLDVAGADVVALRDAAAASL
ncbi:MAG: Clp protease, partial [Solirubrobacterales bacterium]|nr:Clp protease [Solirubrobacterales bacterium]